MASSSTNRQSTPRETAASFGVLAVLVAVVAWLAVTQRHASPAVTVAATAALAAERDAAARSRLTTDASAASAASPAPADVAGRIADLLQPWPAGLRAMSPAEAFTPATLSDKIDGKAELYLAAGFVGMRCQRVAAASGGWFEFFSYEMRTPTDAFAVFSSQKRNATRDAAVGDYAYAAGNQLCVVHGPYYLEFVGADDAPATLDAAMNVARQFIAATRVARHANIASDAALFPTGDRVGDPMLMSADVFGFDQLNNTYVARYREGSGTCALFLTRRDSPAAATELATATRRFFIDDCGGQELPAPTAPAGAVLVDLGGTIDGVFTSGSVVAGIHEAPDRATAERRLQQLAALLGGPR